MHNTGTGTGTDTDKQQQQPAIRQLHHQHGELDCSMSLPCSRSRIELDLELIQTQMTQKPMLRAEVGMRVRLRKQSKCGVIHKGEEHWPQFSQKLHKARHLWVAADLE